MENLKNKNIKELIKDIDNILYYLHTYNKNYNKKQYENIDDLIDLFQELTERIN